MRIITLICLCLLPMFFSCAMAPRVANHEYSTQEKMESVAHWEKLAREVVQTQVLISLPVNPDLAKVYVDDSDQTDFGKAFYTYLVTELMNSGVLVTESPVDANTVKWSTQLVWHSKDKWMPGVVLGAVELVGYIVAGSGVVQPPNDLELIITTQVNRDYMVLTRMTHNYYLDNSSKWNFYEPNNGKKYAKR